MLPTVTNRDRSRWYIGMRVGVLKGIDGGVARLIGYGTYNGVRVPSGVFIGPTADLVAEGRATVEILLDSGQKVYGCECWWERENFIRGIVKQCDVVIRVDIDEERKAAVS